MVQTVFENLLKTKINLSQTQISQGSVSHNYIRGLLDNKKNSDPSFPWLISGDFLSGSYARGTKICPLDDIDVMIILDGTGLRPIRNGFYLNADVRGSATVGSPVNQLTDSLTGYISSQKVLNAFCLALKESYPNSKITKDGQAVNVWLESHGLGLDIVPAFHIIPRDNGVQSYYIPAGGSSNMWLETNPEIDKAICQTLDNRHNNRFKPLVKLIKFWNNEYNAGRLRSYHIESAAYHIFSRYVGVINSFDVAMTHFFNNFEPYVYHCPDPTQIGEKIDRYLDSGKRLLSINRIREVKNNVGSPLLAGLAMPERRVAVWNKFFGNKL